MKKASYEEIKSTLKTGDLILFHGELLSSEITEVIQLSKWSHVAMVIDPKDIGIDYSRLVLWESNTLENLDDVELSKSKQGPMLIDLEERVKTDKDEKYDDIFRIRYLNPGLCESDKQTLYSNLRSFINKAHSGGYPKSELKMFKDVFDGLFKNREDEPNNYFCSDLIADTYIHMGLLPDEYVPSSYMPRDFSDKGDLPLLKRATLYNGPYFEVK